MESIPDSLIRRLRDRQGLLWVCQRQDLIAGQDPHDYDLPESSAALRYRTESNDEDIALGSLYWESIWLEGARSQVLSALRSATENQPSSSRRPLVILASESDAHAQVSVQEFLPIHVLPGILDSQAAPDARYGAMRGKQRERRAAWPLAERLASFPGRLLVVAGASEAQDLDRLYDLLEDMRILDLHLLLIWSADVLPPTPPNPGVVFHIWRGKVQEFVSAAQREGVPPVGQLPIWSLRIGTRTVKLQARDLHDIQRQFTVLTEQDLISPESFTTEDLTGFLSNLTDEWAGFGAGLPVPRQYRSDTGKSLVEEVEDGFRHLLSDSNPQLTYSIHLPCEGGSGATTMLRHAAYTAASRGYPTLVLRPERLRIDTEQLLAFLTTLTEAAAAVRAPDNHPLLIVLDVQHGTSTGVRQLPQLFAAHGKRAVILQAVPLDEKNTTARRGSHRVQLPPLRATATNVELQDCETAIRSLVNRWRLPIDVPTLGQWESYESATRTRTPSGHTGHPNSSLFWVGLRYFLTEGMDANLAEGTRSALGSWVAKRIRAVTDSDMLKVVTYIAALSAVRIASPLWTVLRPITGGEFRSELSQVLAQCGEILTWDEYSEEVEDYLVRFLHPALAEEYLREQGFVVDIEREVHILYPVLAMLSNGKPGDIWLAEEIATAVMPKYEDRRNVDWGWRLQLFEQLPLIVRESDKTILHHWARCLYLSADSSDLGSAEESGRTRRFELAIDKLQKAVQIPRRPGQDEHPSHLYNTLGTAYSRYARFLDETLHDAVAAADSWEKSCNAFEKSIALSGDSNIEALLGFSKRLIEHVQKQSHDEHNRVSANLVEDVAHALNLLDAAEDLVKQQEQPEEERSDIASQRAEALNWISRQSGRNYIAELKTSTKPELGYYCEARLAAHGRGDAGVRQALWILAEAERDGVQFGRITILYRISLMYQDAKERYNYAELRRLYRTLEGDPEYVPSQLHAFRHAVLCYQLEDYLDGAKRFRLLRESARRTGNAPLRLRDWWREPNDPTRHRLTVIRVKQVSTEWRAEGFIDEMKQAVPLRPRHFNPPPSPNSIVQCAVRFESNGPFAVPPRFDDTGDKGRPAGRDKRHH